MMASLSSALAQDFIDDMSDIPLMPNLEMIAEAGFTFEQENGRIVEKLAVGTSSEVEIDRFYNDSLPSLGWHVTSGRTYERDNERFTYAIKQENSTSIVTFKLSPTNSTQ